MREAAQELGLPDDGDVSGFPEAGDDLPVCLDHSAWPCFPLEDAERLRAEHPDLWASAAGVLGERQFRRLSALARRDGVPDDDAETMAIRLREAWACRHYQDRTVAGVVAQVTWLVVGAAGLSGMKQIIAAAVAEEDKMEKREMPEFVTCSLTEVAKADDAADGWCVVTSTRPDRVDDVVDVAGLNLSEFRANPVCLWRHNHDEPIGTWEIKTGMSASGAPAILGRPTFATGDAVPVARMVEALWGQKVVRAASIGFQPEEGVPRTNLPSDHPWYKKDSWGYYYAKARLREISIVSIPANQDAVRRRVPAADVPRSPPLASLKFDVVDALEEQVKADPTLKKRLLDLFGIKHEDDFVEPLQETIDAFFAPAFKRD